MYGQYNNKFVDEFLKKQNKIKRLGNVVNSSIRITWQCIKCSNIWKTTPTKIVNTGTKCKKCAYEENGKKSKWTNNIVDEKIKERKIIRISDVKSGKDSCDWRCRICGHEWSSLPVSVITQSHGCPKCWKFKLVTLNKNKGYNNSIIDDKTKNLKLKRCENYNGMLSKIQWKCDICTNIWMARPNDIINNNSGCPNCSHRNYSKIAIRWLNAVMLKEKVHILHAENGGEFNIQGTKLRVDGYSKETNTIYEFYGDVYHGNPKMFTRYEKCHPFNDKTVEELNKETLFREELIHEKGFNLVTIWEQDFINSYW